MLHPHTELRFVSEAIGYGVFATRLIPRGTITWVHDELDVVLSPARLASMPALYQGFVEKYGYTDGKGCTVLCWDNGRFVNHSCNASCRAAGFDFEIAVRDILPGEELTDDYGSLNASEPFACLCGEVSCRHWVGQGDFERYGPQWDALVGESFPDLGRVSQPLWELVREKDQVTAVLEGRLPLPSCLAHFHRGGMSVVEAAPAPVARRGGLNRTNGSNGSNGTNGSNGAHASNGHGSNGDLVGKAGPARSNGSRSTKNGSRAASNGSRSGAGTHANGNGSHVAASAPAEGARRRS